MICFISYSLIAKIFKKHQFKVFEPSNSFPRRPLWRVRSRRPISLPWCRELRGNCYHLAWSSRPDRSLCREVQWTICTWVNFCPAFSPSLQCKMSMLQYQSCLKITVFNCTICLKCIWSWLDYKGSGKYIAHVFAKMCFVRTLLSFLWNMWNDWQ